MIYRFPFILEEGTWTLATIEFIMRALWMRNVMLFSNGTGYIVKNNSAIKISYQVTSEYVRIW